MRQLVKPKIAIWLAALALLPATAGAAELKDGTWVFGVGGGAGIRAGAAKAKVSTPFLISGYALYAPREEHSWGLNVDRVLFKPKAGNKVDAVALTFVGRAYLSGRFQEVLPYALFGLGYSETHADLAAGGTDRGSGPTFSLGGGFHRVRDSHLSWGGEARLMRLASGLPRLGLGGVTLLALTVSVAWRTDPAANPFER